MRELEYSICSIFTGGKSNKYNGGYSGYVVRSNDYFLEIPIKEGTMEIPALVLANRVARTSIVLHETSMIALNLYSKGCCPSYKTIARYMRDELMNNYKNNMLVSTDVKKDGATERYYITYGMILNKNFIPVTMFSWQVNIEKHYPVRTITLEKPILRVDPNIFTNQDDEMKRFIVKKLIPCSLKEFNGNDVSFTYEPNSFIPPQRTIRASVIIETSPFIPRRVIKPKADISNEDLITTILRHKNDLVT